MIPPIFKPGDVFQRFQMPNAAGVEGKYVRIASVSGDLAQLEWVNNSASDITEGTLAAARLPATAVQTTGSYADPAWITALAASKITGTLMKSQQHAQTAYKDEANTWAQAQTFNGAIGVEQDSPLAPVHVGSGNQNNSTDAMVLISRNAIGATNGHAFSDSTNFAKDSGTSFNSFDARVTTSGANNYGHYAAFQSIPTLNGSGTVTDVYHLYSALVQNAGTSVNVYGHYVANATGAGSVTNQYGLYVAALTKGATNYAIYTDSTTPSYFGGTVRVNGAFSSGAEMGIGTTTPTSYLSGVFGAVVYNSSAAGIAVANANRSYLWYVGGTSLKLYDSTGDRIEVTNGAVTVNGPFAAGASTFNGTVSCPQATDGERFGIGASVADYSTAVGKNATCTTNGVAVGGASSAAHTGVAVGAASSAGSGATALGTQATGIQTTIAIGYQATTTNLYAVALGNVAEAAFYSTALGYATKAPYSYSIALGAHAENTANNQLTIGSPTAPISQITFPGSNNVTIVNPATFNGSVKLGIKTIATLPSAASSSGERYQVSDSATIANRIAFSNGSAWYYEGTAVAV